MLKLKWTSLWVLLFFMTVSLADSESSLDADETSTQLNKKQAKELSKVLRQVLEDDQKYRSVIHELINQASPAVYEDVQTEIEQLWIAQSSLDLKNQEIIDNILSQYGWPDRMLFKSTEEMQTIFLVIKHADIAFQAKHFPLLQKASNTNQLPKGAVAILHDKILVNRGEMQRYGTQIKIDETSGEAVFYPIEDEINLNIRRLAVGLPPIEEYAKMFNVDYKLQEEKSVQ